MAVNFFPDAGTSTGGGVTGDYIPLTQRGSANGVATLDSSAKIPQSQLPNISITDTFVVDSESEMLELIAQKGDIAVRTDNNKTFILQSTPATSLSNWVELPTPTDGVFSVDGKIGAVVLSNDYQAKSNELSALSALSNTPGFIKKISDGVYAIDSSSYLTTTSASASYQPLNSGLTSIGGLTIDGFLVKVGGAWGMDTNSYQIQDGDLTAIASLSTTGYLERTGTNTWRTVPGPFQPLDSNLTDIAGLTGNGIIRKTAGVWGIDSANYQLANNELSGFSALPDTQGFVRKVGDGSYTLDANTYLTTSSAMSSYQPLNTNLTNISGVTGTSGFLKQAGGVWGLDGSTYITGNQNITISGDVTGSGTTAINVTLPNVVTAGSSAKPTYNSKGLVTGSGSLVASDIPNLDWAKITSGKPITLSGYGITDALTTAGAGLTSTGNTINVVGTSGRIIANTDSIDLATVGTAGTYAKATTDAYGRVIGGSALIASDIPNLDASKITSGYFLNKINIADAAFTNRGIQLSSVVASSPSVRWLIYASFGTESGGNTSSNLGIVSYADDGTQLAIPFMMNRSNGVISLTSTVQSTSTTTGAVTSQGGAGFAGALFAQSLNGQLVLNRYTTATRPVASASTLGQAWLNTTTGKIEYVATSSTIQVITSA
jgi:hypothetical protein